MNVLRALTVNTLEHYEVFSSDFDEFVYFFEALLFPSERDTHLRWIDHSTETTSLTGLKKKKKKRRPISSSSSSGRTTIQTTTKKAKASLFRQSLRLNSSVFRIIVSDLNFPKNLCARRFPQISGSLEVYFITRAAKEERNSLFRSIIIVLQFILFHILLALSLSQMKQQQKTLSRFNKIQISFFEQGKEETQKEAKNAFAAPFKRKNFSSEEGGDRRGRGREEEKQRKRRRRIRRG